MAHDGSLASNAEAWLITTIGGITEIPAANVVPFEGLIAHDHVGQILEQLRGKRSPWVTVMFQGFDPRETTEGNQDYALMFAVWVTVQNEREGAARIGEAGTPVKAGTNLLTERIIAALDNATPPTAGTVLAGDQVQVQPGKTLAFTKGVSTVEIAVTILASRLTT